MQQLWGSGENLGVTVGCVLAPTPMAAGRAMEQARDDDDGDDDDDYNVDDRDWGGSGGRAVGRDGRRLAL